MVGQAASGEEAWELLRSRAVDVLVTDIEMPGLDGLALATPKVKEGGVVVAPELAVEAWSEANPLSERGREVLRLAGEGMSGPAIADALSLSAGTVRNYLSDAIGKLGASGRIEAYRLPRDKGWV